MSAAVFFDRDGVLNQVVMRGNVPGSPRTMQEFSIVDDAREAVLRLQAHGFLTIVASNQPDLARGSLDPEEHQAMLRSLRETVPVDVVYVCQADSDRESFDKKPNPGMLLKAARAHDIDLERSFMIGDTWKDVAAAKGAGCCAVLIDCPYNQDVHACQRVSSLEEAVEFILGASEE